MNGTRLGLSLLFIVLVFVTEAPAQLAGMYRTASGLSASYHFDIGDPQTRSLPLDATFEFTRGNASTALTAMIHQPIIGVFDFMPGPPGGLEFPLTVTSTSTNGRDFHGNLLGTQYIFDWTFEPISGGALSWDGTVYWAGGRIEESTISDARLLPIPEPSVLILAVSGALALLTVRRFQMAK